MTPEHAALCERLKKVVSRPSMAGGILRVKKSEVTAWLSAIERLSAENEALRTAGNALIAALDTSAPVNMMRDIVLAGDLTRQALKGADQ